MSDTMSAKSHLRCFKVVAAKRLFAAQPSGTGRHL
jgi:hypothetical protein